MANKIVLKGTGLTRGVAEGEALVTKQPVNMLATYMQGFMLNKPSSVIGDARHELFGKDIKGKILIFPYASGSLACGACLLEAIKQGVAPKALVGIEMETAIVEGAIFSDVFLNLPLPIVQGLDKNPLEIIRTGDQVKVDANTGVVEVTRKR